MLVSLCKLEKALSTVLVFRDSRKLELSSAGEVFYQRVCAILEALRDAEYQIGARRSSISGVLRVTLQSGSLVEVLPGILACGETPVWFLKPQNNLTTRKTEAFFDFMQSVFDAELAHENP